MSGTTIQQVFGTNATETTTELIISKFDLATVGLTPTSNNNAEGLLVAIILLAIQYLNPNQQSIDSSIQVTITSQGPLIINLNSSYWRKVTYIFTMQTNTDYFVNPNNY